MRYLSLTLCAALLGYANPATAADAIPKKVVLAKVTGAAVVLYDATPEVAAIVHDKLADADANVRLQRDAMRVLVLEAPSLKGADSVTIRVTYSKSGDVSPVYGTPTFAGMELYATLTAPGSAIRSDRNKFKEAAATAAAPGWEKFAIVGTLPPR